MNTFLYFLIPFVISSSIPNSLLKYSSDNFDITLLTTIPSLNLDAVPGITKIRCQTESFVRVTLTDINVVSSWNMTESGILLLIGPQWKCDNIEQHVFKKAVSYVLKDQTVYFHVKDIIISDHTKDLFLSFEPQTSNYTKPLSINWKKSKLDLVKNKEVELVCEELGIDSDLIFTLSIYKSKYPFHAPLIEAHVSGKFNMMVDFLFQKRGIKSISNKNVMVFEKKFPQIVIGGLITIDPTFLVTAGYNVPNGPIGGLKGGVEFISNDFSTQISSMKIKTNSTSIPLKLDIKHHSISFDSKKIEESDITIDVDFTGSLNLKLNLAGAMDYQVGAGIKTFFEGNLQTGKYANESCQDGETKLSLSIGASAITALQDQVNLVGPLSKKEVLFVCK